MSIDFVGIDFETANRHRSSPCSVGLVRVRDGVIVKTAYWLMRPPVATETFEQRNIDVHGITPDMVADQPRFGERFPKLMAGIGEDVLVAHNAIFDVGVLIASAKADRLDEPNPHFVCTRDLAKVVLPHLPKFTLPVVTAELGITLDDHHEALADAVAAAEVMIALCRRAGYDEVESLARHYPVTSPRALYGQHGGPRRPSAARVPA